MKKGYLEQCLEWCPPGRRRNGRPGNSWVQEVTTGMGKELITWNKSTRKKENKTLGIERYENTDTLYINN